MLPGAVSRPASIQTAWLLKVNGFWERGRQPGVIYRQDLIEWNTIHPMWHPESVLRTIFLAVMMSYDRKGWVYKEGRLFGISQNEVKKKYSNETQLSKCSNTTNLFTHFTGCGNIGLLFWLHPSSGNDPLVRMSTTAHKQHLSRMTTVLLSTVWHSYAIRLHIYIYTHGACKRSEQRQSLDWVTTICASCCRVKKFIFPLNNQGMTHRDRVFFTCPTSAWWVQGYQPTIGEKWRLERLWHKFWSNVHVILMRFLKTKQPISYTVYTALVTRMRN